MKPLLVDDYTPLLEGLPAGTRFTNCWLPREDVYRFWLASDTHGIHTVDELGRRDLSRLTGHHYITELINRKIAALRQRHYFACVYSRGGYC